MTQKQTVQIVMLAVNILVAVIIDYLTYQEAKATDPTAVWKWRPLIIKLTVGLTSGLASALGIQLAMSGA